MKRIERLFIIASGFSLLCACGTHRTLASSEPSATPVPTSGIREGYAPAADADETARQLEALLPEEGSITRRNTYTSERFHVRYFDDAYYVTCNEDYENTVLFAAKKYDMDTKTYSLSFFHTDEVTADGSLKPGCRILDSWENNHHMYYFNDTRENRSTRQDTRDYFDLPYDEDHVTAKYTDDYVWKWPIKTDTYTARYGYVIYCFQSEEEWLRACIRDDEAYSILGGEYREIHAYKDECGRWGATGVINGGSTAASIESIPAGRLQPDIVCGSSSGQTAADSSLRPEDTNVNDYDNPDDYAYDNQDAFDSYDDAWEYWCDYAEDADC